MKTFSDYNIDLMGKTGTEIRVLCPTCAPERKKNNLKELCVNTESGAWFCQHCGWSGGLGAEKKTYVTPSYTAELKLPEHVICWFKDRGITGTTLEAMKIGYGPIWMPSTDKEEMALQFPFYKKGAVVNIKYRDGHKNFRQAKGAEKVFYGFDRMTHADPCLIITEGEIDTLSLIECGFHDVVSMPDGAPAANAKSYNTKFDFLRASEVQLSGYKKIILAVDNDAPGQLAEQELARRLGAERCYRVTYPAECKDANDTLMKHGRQALKKVIKEARPLPVKGLHDAMDFMRPVSNLYNQGAEKGDSTGWRGVDNYFTCRPGELTIVTGCPGSGKSNWLDCLMLNLTMKHDWRHAIFSPENHPIESHLSTLAEKVNRKPFSKSFGKTYPRMTHDELEEAIYMINDNMLFMNPAGDDEEPTVDKIIELAKKAVFRNGIKCLTIDPWNELAHDFGKLSETQYISRELGKLRRFGKNHGVHIFIVAHPQKLQRNGQGTYDPPDMYSIAGGAHFNNKADNGICVHRIYAEGKKDHTEIHIKKIRFRDIGTIGQHTLRFEFATGCYIDDLPNGVFDNEKDDSWD